MKTADQLDREIEDNDLAAFVSGAKKYDALKRARLAYLVESILRDRGVATAGADVDALTALARAELARGVAASQATPGMLTPSTKKAVQSKRPRRGWDLTGELARSMPRFEFIANWLVVVTRKKENRGPLGLYVRRVGKRWQIMSPVGGGTVTFETTDPALLFDYARRGQLGREIRDADAFRGLAYERAKPE